MIRSIVVSCIVALTLSAVWAKNYEDKSFQYSAAKLPIKVAVLPIFSKEATILDTAFAIMYGLDSGKVELIGPKALRDRIVADTTLSRILDTISKFEYTKEQRKTGPSLSQVLGDSDILSLRKSIDSAEFLLIPTRFGVGSLGIATGGKLNLRLYNLGSGLLVYEREQSINVDQTGEQGRRSLIIGIVAFSKDDFIKYFLKKAGLR